jgi:tetratricopeptide (TPR) repeat protein
MNIAFSNSVCQLFCVGIILYSADNWLAAADITPSAALYAKSAGTDSAKDAPDAKNEADGQGRTERIDKLIKQLGDKDYYVRERAQGELSRMNFEAFDALNAALSSDDLEIASRAKYLLRLMRNEWTTKDDPPEVQKLLKDYQRQTDDVRQARMHVLATMPDGKGLLPLCRLIRFEQSDALSKLAVIELLKSPTGADPPKGPKAEAMRKLFENGGRTSVTWALAWLRLGDAPQSISQWSGMIRNETMLLQRSPGETSAEVVSALIHFQAAWLKKLGLNQEALIAMRRLIDLVDKDDPEDLYELLDWLLVQKAWTLADELAARFPGRFDKEPLLLYMLAEAQKERGETDKAEQTAHRAFTINTGKDATTLLDRLIPGSLLDLYPNSAAGPEQMKILNRFLVAQRLTRLGLFDWAKREYEYVIAQGKPIDQTTINAQWSLSEMFHDQGQELLAASVLDSMLAKVDAKSYASLPTRITSVLQQRYYSYRKIPAEKVIDRTMDELRARKYFLQSCHWKTAGDEAKYRDCLKQALELKPQDLDVLIACYQMPDQTPDEHKKILDLIRQATNDIRAGIASDPDNAEYYNYFAWLVANTEGDFDEALKFSQKSVELSPDSGGLYDTLARAYYAKGDYENAVKNQQHAFEMEPHSGQIARQLELFKKAREEHKK